MKDKTFLTIKKCLMDQIKATEQIIESLKKQEYAENNTCDNDSLVSMKNKFADDLNNLVDAYNDILDFEWIGF